MSPISNRIATRSLQHQKVLAVALIGLCFMVKARCESANEKGRLVARIDPEIPETALGRKGCTSTPHVVR